MLESWYVDNAGHQNTRRFIPQDVQGRDGRLLNHVLVYNTHDQLYGMQLQWPNGDLLESRDRTLVVFIDGACPGNGSPHYNPPASYGVFFGPGSHYNACGLLSDHIPHTSTRAEIEAFAIALDMLIDICGLDYGRPPLCSQVIIATDSEYLVLAMSMYIYKWIEDGGFKRDGKPVAHYQRLKELNEKMRTMKLKGVHICLWHIPCNENYEADRLANWPLHQAGYT